MLEYALLYGISQTLTTPPNNTRAVTHSPHSDRYASVRPTNF